MSWERTRSFFPVTRELVYLNHAGVAPISTRVQEALARYAAEALQHGAFRYDDVFDAEIERGNILLEINRQPVHSIDDFRRLTANTRSGEVLALYLFKPEGPRRELRTVKID